MIAFWSTKRLLTRFGLPYGCSSIAIVHRHLLPAIFESRIRCTLLLEDFVHYLQSRSSPEFLGQVLALHSVCGELVDIRAVLFRLAPHIDCCLLYRLGTCIADQLLQ